MFVLSLCNQLSINDLPVRVGVRLGEGADGEVLSIIDDPVRVIKLGILYERHDHGLDKYYQQIERTLTYIERTQPGAYVRVFEHGYLGTFDRKAAHWRSGKQGFILYYYIMEKLCPTTEDEQKVFHSILSHEDRGIKKDLSLNKIEKMLQGLSSGLDFDEKKITLFCNNIKEAALSHLDMAPRNIMKNELGEFKLIDLDRVSLIK